MKTFYRVGNKNHEGLWYDKYGNFVGLIHDKFDFCKNKNLPMPFDKNVVGWLSATKTLDELYFWFSIEDIKELQKHGYSILEYKTSLYKRYKNHYIIKPETVINEIFT